LIPKRFVEPAEPPDAAAASAAAPRESSTERLTFARRGRRPPSMTPAPDLDRVFAALADPTRRAIMTGLLPGPRTVGELAAPHAMTLAAVSKHLAILVRAGLVVQARTGRVTTCRLDPDGLRAAGLWMQGLGGFDPEDYDALEALLAATLSAAADDEPTGPDAVATP
jgi:DNA-binding transcriptional ArsR family regulator